jgi:hypothetical protein
LMRVPTTIEQAQQRLERNQRLLELMENRESGDVDIGCPHCSLEMRCSTCAWKIVFDWSPFNYPCCKAEFGGVSHRDCMSVDYWSDKAAINWIEDRSQEEDENDITFLKGHLEWAMLVIAKGGVDWPDKIGDPEVEREDD